MITAAVVLCSLALIVALVAVAVAAQSYMVLWRMETEFKLHHSDMRTVMGTAYSLLNELSLVKEKTNGFDASLKRILDKTNQVNVPSTQDLRAEFDAKVAALPEEYKQHFLKDDRAYEIQNGHKRRIDNDFLEQVNRIARLTGGA